MSDVDESCIFCQIASGAVPSKKVYEDEIVTCVLDINPANLGHILVIPKKHVQVLPQIDDEAIAHIGKVVKHLSLAMLKSLGVQGTTTFVAIGGIAGQRAPHVIIHVIPRAEGDGVFGQVSSPVKKPEGKVDLDAITEALDG